MPIDAIADMDFARADKNPKPEALDAVATKLRAALKAMGRKEVAG